MRVIAGTARGRRLVVPPGQAVRPTGDRVREALFSSIARRLRGAVVLDLYAGSGALGIEALSRGAAQATFVECEREALEAVRANCRAAGVTDLAEVVAGRAVAHLRARSGPLVDLAFLDPPYALGDQELAEVLDLLVAQLAPGAMVIVERDAASPVPAWPADLEPDGDRVYGSTRLHRAVRADVDGVDAE